MSDLAEKIIRQIDHANCHPFACEADREEAVEIVDEHLSSLKAEIVKLREAAASAHAQHVSAEERADAAEDTIARIRSQYIENRGDMTDADALAAIKIIVGQSLAEDGNYA